MGKPAATATAMLQCSFGVAPSTLVVLPLARVLVEGKPAAAVTDMLPGVNIPPFGMCTSLANPMVAAATAAALGVLTPMPCIPATVGPVDERGDADPHRRQARPDARAPPASARTEASSRSSTRAR